MAITIDGTTGITTPGLVNTGTESVVGLTTTGNTILGDASTDTLNVGNGGLVKDASGNVGIGTSSPNNWPNGKLVVAATSASPANIYLARNANAQVTQPTVYGTTDSGFLSFYQGDSAVNYQRYFDIVSDGSLGMAKSNLRFWTNMDSAAPVERMRIDSSGNLLVGTTSASVPSTTGFVSSANTFGFKNRIINGGMVIDQRNAGASVATSSGAQVYAVDRWQAVYSQVSKFTLQQNAASVTLPTGFINYLGITSSSAYTVGSGEQFNIRQAIEGLNVTDLGWGTASASTVTLSFWVRSSLTGTFGGCLMNGASNRSYPFTFTISAANTWEQKSVTVAGDTTGTWLTTNGVGLYVWFGLGVGSTLSATAGAWSAGYYPSATGAVSVVGTSGATFYITGVQLEKGSVATSFDQRAYSQELAMCQRYFQTLTSVVGWAGLTNKLWINPCWSPMRATPTWGQTGLLSLTEPGVSGPTQSGVGLTQAGGASPTNGFYTIDNLTTTAGRMYMTNGNTNYITLSAEL